MTVWNAMARENRIWWCNKICFTNENKILVFRSKTWIKKKKPIPCSNYLVFNVNYKYFNGSSRIFRDECIWRGKCSNKCCYFQWKMMKLQQEQPRAHVLCTNVPCTLHIDVIKANSVEHIKLINPNNGTISIRMIVRHRDVIFA